MAELTPSGLDPEFEDRLAGAIVLLIEHGFAEEMVDAIRSGAVTWDPVRLRRLYMRLATARLSAT